MTRFLQSLMMCLLLTALPLAVSGCATKATVRSNYPPLADLQPKAKPVLNPDCLSSELCLTVYNIELEGWGEEGWSAVRRVCEYHKSHGLKVDCTPR